VLLVLNQKKVEGCPIAPPCLLLCLSRPLCLSVCRSFCLPRSLTHTDTHTLSASRSICAIAPRFSDLSLTALAALTHPVATLAAPALSDRASLAQHLYHLFIALAQGILLRCLSPLRRRADGQRPGVLHFPRRRSKSPSNTHPSTVSLSELPPALVLLCPAYTRPTPATR